MLLTAVENGGVDPYRPDRRLAIGVIEVRRVRDPALVAGRSSIMHRFSALIA